MILLFLALAQIPSFALKDLDGNEVVLDSLLKKGLVVFEFWDIPCKPCVRKLDTFKELNKEFDNVTFVGINEDGPRNQKRVPVVVKARKWDFLILYDENRKAMKSFQVQATPHTFIIGKGREILYQKVGFKKGDKELLRKKLESLLKEVESDQENSEEKD